MFIAKVLHGVEYFIIRLFIPRRSGGRRSLRLSLFSPVVVLEEGAGGRREDVLECSDGRVTKPTGGYDLQVLRMSSKLAAQLGTLAFNHDAPLTLGRGSPCS